MHNLPVPANLRRWFIAHFIADLLFAIPLLLAPGFTLGLFGFNAVETLTARLVGAALLAIGVESYLGRNASRETYRAMLSLKVIWATTATLSLLWALFFQAAPPATWLFLIFFLVFGSTWIYYRWQLR